MLSERRARILSIIIAEYMETVAPVGSETIQRKYTLGVSPATIRNDMAWLEEEGYITHPHTSAGRVPSDKGYRYYIDQLMPRATLPPDEQVTIRHQFLQASQDLEQWVRLAAAVLARSARNVALVTPPKVSLPRVKHVELAPLRDLMLLVLLVLQESRVRRHILPLDEPLAVESIPAVAGRLNALLQGMSQAEVRAVLATAPMRPVENLIARTVVEMLQAEEQRTLDQPYLEGLRNLLNQPEFASADRIRSVIDLLEDPVARDQLFTPLGPTEAWERTPQVVIGSEHREGVEGMERLSVVIASYGVPGEALGALAVVGPTRMAYPRVMAAVNYLADLMTEMLEDRMQ